MNNIAKLINHGSSFCGCSEPRQTWKSCHNRCKAIPDAGALLLLCDLGSCVILDKYSEITFLGKAKYKLSSCVSPKPMPGWSSFHSQVQGTGARVSSSWRRRWWRPSPRRSCRRGGSGRRWPRRGTQCPAPWTQPSLPCLRARLGINLVRSLFSFLRELFYLFSSCQYPTTCRST